jgi:ABC-type multidrug transport system fused ATPase/permease subunit
VRGLQARHRAHLPLVLRGLSFAVASGERVGVVGRTGSGKSSLALALVRLIRPISADGSAPVLLDGTDTRLLSLHALRRAVAMVPQVSE